MRVLGSGDVESEYFLTGTAGSYRPAGTWGSDGRWTKVVDGPRQRFRTADSYLAAYRQRADAAVAAGIMTPADRGTALRAAATVEVTG